MDIFKSPFGIGLAVLMIVGLAYATSASALDLNHVDWLKPEPMTAYSNQNDAIESDSVKAITSSISLKASLDDGVVPADAYRQALAKTNAMRQREREEAEAELRELQRGCAIGRLAGYRQHIPVDPSCPAKKAAARAKLAAAQAAQLAYDNRPDVFGKPTPNLNRLQVAGEGVPASMPEVIPGAIEPQAVPMGQFKPYKPKLVHVASNDPHLSMMYGPVADLQPKPSVFDANAAMPRQAPSPWAYDLYLGGRDHSEWSGNEGEIAFGGRLLYGATVGSRPIVSMLGIGGLWQPDTGAMRYNVEALVGPVFYTDGRSTFYGGVGPRLELGNGGATFGGTAMLGIEQRLGEKSALAVEVATHFMTDNKPGWQLTLHWRQGFESAWLN